MTQTIGAEMQVSTADLVLAKEAVNDLLERLGLKTYLFEVVPRNGRWEVRLDCEIPQGWQSVTLPVDKSALIASRHEASVRDSVLSGWRSRLATCNTGSPGT